jgi:hypothetical protein
VAELWHIIPTRSQAIHSWSYSLMLSVWWRSSKYKLHSVWLEPTKDRYVTLGGVHVCVWLEPTKDRYVTLGGVHVCVWLEPTKDRYATLGGVHVCLITGRNCLPFTSTWVHIRFLVGSLDCPFLIASSVFSNVYSRCQCLWFVHSWLPLRFSLTFTHVASVFGVSILDCLFGFL